MSGWSPESFLIPSVVPEAPPQPDYVSSSDTEIELQFFRSLDDGGLPITDYELHMDEGDVTSDFSKVASYDFATDNFAYTVLAADNLLTPGLYYRFKIRAYNSLGWSEFSNSLMVGLGPKPSKPVAPSKSLDEESNSPTSIKMEWSELLSQSLTVTAYTLYMDDGFGVTFTPVYQGQFTEFDVEDLTPGIMYSFYVTATNFNGEGEASEIRELKSCVRP